MKNAFFVILILLIVLISNSCTATNNGKGTKSSAPTAQTQAKMEAKMASNPNKSQLKEELTPMQYKVTQENGTEPPFNNKYWDNKEPGIYVDIVSGEPLFASKDKFASGTGWPSFVRPLEESNIVEKKDTSHGMVRVEVRSKKGDSHLGHLFNDGPQPTGQRYCINSAALRFVPARRLQAEGYGQYVKLFDVAQEQDQDQDKSPEQSARPNDWAVATFGAGCFWGVEHLFAKLPGVKSAVSGYMGGDTPNPTYREVCTGKTGHAEVVQVQYDPAQVSYEKLLDYFWRMHNPTTPNQQGPNIGSQYRSVIFYHTPVQKETAQESLKAFAESGVFEGEVITQISPAQAFYKAEEYHQNYYAKNGGHVCHTLRQR